MSSGAGLTSAQGMESKVRFAVRAKGGAAAAGSGKKQRDHGSLGKARVGGGLGRRSAARPLQASRLPFADITIDFSTLDALKDSAMPQGTQGGGSGSSSAPAVPTPSAPAPSASTSSPSLPAETATAPPVDVGAGAGAGAGAAARSLFAFSSRRGSGLGAGFGSSLATTGAGAGAGGGIETAPRLRLSSSTTSLPGWSELTTTRVPWALLSTRLSVTVCPPIATSSTCKRDSSGARVTSTKSAAASLPASGPTLLPAASLVGDLDANTRACCRWRWRPRRAVAVGRAPLTA
mmetsp:Transcript_11355/g.23994  ORF Transcript_11355/g.23994 Transcript_11355/m.23994 type:complete len:291 (-) Transcript_11355:142-1014(-)